MAPEEAMTPPTSAAGCEVDILESGAELHHKDLHRALAAERAKLLNVRRFEP